MGWSPVQGVLPTVYKIHASDYFWWKQAWEPKQSTIKVEEEEHDISVVCN
jgi:hypothetical protein